MIRFENFANLLDRMRASRPRHTAFLVWTENGVRSVAWDEFATLVDKRTDELVESGYACEAVLADGSFACVVEIFAAVQAGLQVALIDPFTPNDAMDLLLNAVDADCIWTSNATRQSELEQLLSPTAKPAFGAHGVLFFTSGTSAASKAVLLTDESLMASAFNGASLLPLSPKDTLLCLLPMSHVFGFVCGLLWGLSCGAAVALGRGPRYYCDDLALFSPTAVSVVPKLLEYLAAREALGNELKLVLVGAADCSDKLLEAVRNKGIRVSLGYGLTETSSGIALSTGDDLRAMTICPEDTVSIAEDGEILVDAPTCLMQGYYRDAEKTNASVREGILHTGDRGFLDESGLLHVQGRMKDVLILSGGTKVYLPEYESAIVLALKEQDIAVVLYDDVLTLVCGKMTRERDERDVKEALSRMMKGYPAASRIGRVARLDHELPRTAAGDIERWKILEELQHGDC